MHKLKKQAMQPSHLYILKICGFPTPPHSEFGFNYTTSNPLTLCKIIWLWSCYKAITVDVYCSDCYWK